MRISTIAIACAAAMACFAAATAHEIDLHKLPLGDGKISHEPKRGWIWACHVDPHGGGAQRVGPWIDLRHHTYDLTAKIAVRGAVRWPHSFDIARRGDERVFTSNDLPNHPTGHFPIARNDPAFRIDRNPNSIRRQHIHFELPAHPTWAAHAHCAPGAVGILLTGVALFNALDAPGRDAVAHETQDRCHGHPQAGGVYHYHSLTNCLNDKPGPDGDSPLVGYAIDGFGIYGSYE
ncbi:MAG TPA: YHYH protein, partial [Pseudolabrys sp.]|nr:YHYH protein [Pseudolabrys sp.]